MTQVRSGVAGAAALMLILGCGDGAESAASSSASSALVVALCTARDDARHGDAAAANREYYDHAHQPLHDLAAQVSATDRAVAARLLEAHQVVESDLAAQPTPADLATHLTDLVDRTRDAVAGNGEPDLRPVPTEDR